MKRVKLLFIAILIIIFNSCSYVFVEAYGIDHRTDLISQQDISKEAEKVNLSEGEVYLMDSSFVDYLLSLDTSLFLFAKNNYQPLQYKVFDSEGKLVSHLANCYAGGFPNLKWDWMFDQFPPSVNNQLFDSLLTFEEAKKYFIPIGNVTESNTRKKYSDVVIWTAAFGRQNKRFLETVREFRETHAGEANYYFVNFDNCFHKMMT